MNPIAARSFGLIALFASACATGATSAAVDDPAAAAAPVVHQDPVAQATGLRARLEVDAHAESFTVRLFVQNLGAVDRQLVCGHGGSGLANVPSFRFGWLRIEPPRYLVPPRRSMRLDYKVVGAGKEVLYGSWTLGYPPAAPGPGELTATIGFREDKLQLETPPVTLVVPVRQDGR